MDDNILAPARYLMNKLVKLINYENKIDKAESSKNHALFFPDYFHSHFLQ